MFRRTLLGIAALVTAASMAFGMAFPGKPSGCACNEVC